ncbi:MAG: hypothetical protein WCT47_11015 [Betaproteobacteria bacterium]|jgi:hypothetical protein
MAFTARDVVPFTQARAHLTVLAHQAKADVETIITNNSERCVTPIDANRLDATLAFLSEPDRDRAA